MVKAQPWGPPKMGPPLFPPQKKKPKKKKKTPKKIFFFFFWGENGDALNLSWPVGSEKFSGLFSDVGIAIQRLGIANGPSNRISAAEASLS